jgi:hypothetical protein
MQRAVPERCHPTVMSAARVAQGRASSACKDVEAVAQLHHVDSFASFN